MNTPSMLKYCIPLTDSKRVHRKYFYSFQISFSLVSERLRYCNFVHRHNFTSANYTKIPIISFDTEMGRLCSYKILHFICNLSGTELQKTDRQTDGRSIRLLDAP